MPTHQRTNVDDLNEEEGLLLRAADLIGQLGDPNYMRKSNALFYEFEEIGLNKTLGYATPADIVYKFPQFYWTNVAPQIQLAIRYLNVTSSGRQWIANLHSNVFRAEREVNLNRGRSDNRRCAAGLNSAPASIFRRAAASPTASRVTIMLPGMPPRALFRVASLRVNRERPLCCCARNLQLPQNTRLTS